MICFILVVILAFFSAIDRFCYSNIIYFFSDLYYSIQSICQQFVPVAFGFFNRRLDLFISFTRSETAFFIAIWTQKDLNILSLTKNWNIYSWAHLANFGFNLFHKNTPTLRKQQQLTNHWNSNYVKERNKKSKKIKRNRRWT